MISGQAVLTAELRRRGHTDYIRRKAIIEAELSGKEDPALGSG